VPEAKNKHLSDEEKIEHAASIMRSLAGFSIQDVKEILALCDDCLEEVAG